MAISALTLTVILGSSLAWAGFDATRKRLTGVLDPMPLVVWLMVGQLVPFGIWMAVDGAPLPGPDYLAPAAATVALNVVANVAFLTAVQKSPLSVTIPLLSLTPVFSAVVGVVLLGESPTLQQTVGLVAIVLGALGLQAPEGEGPLALLRAWRREPGAPWMALVAVLWSASAVLDKAATAASTESVHGFVLCAGIALSLLVWLGARKRLGELKAIRRAPGLWVAATACGTAALALQLVAFQWTLVSLVEAIKRAVGMTMALVIGRLAFDERIPPRRIVAVGVMIVGGALLVGA